MSEPDGSRDSAGFSIAARSVRCSSDLDFDARRGHRRSSGVYKLPLALSAAQLSEGVDGGFTLAGADYGPVAFVGGARRIERFASRTPCRPITTKHQVVLDGKLESRAGELPLHGEHGRKTAAIGEASRSISPKGIQPLSSRRSTAYSRFILLLPDTPQHEFDPA